MKKLLTILTIFGVSVATGLLLFNNQKVVIESVSSNDLKQKTIDLSDKSISSKNRLDSKKKNISSENVSEDKSYVEMMREINEYLSQSADRDDAECKSLFNKTTVTKDYIDPKSSFFSTNEGREKSIHFLNQLNNITNRAFVVDYNIENIMSFDNWNPIDIKTKMSQSIICQDVDYTNLTHGFIKSLKDPNIDPAQKQSYLFNLIYLSQSFASSRRPVEYKFYAMEVLFGLMDNELIPKNYNEELVNLRQQVITTVQNFESDFRLSNDARTNRELLRAYKDSNEDIRVEINLLTERLLNETRLNDEWSD
tara:strand:+ start:214 stop:1140 length:927 start_codon:yes stop_codon:yes gene_type:complete